MNPNVLIIPVYNEAPNLPNLLPNLSVLKEKMDVVFINDGSTDDTPAILKQAGFSVVSHPKNRGYVAVVETGLRFADEKGYDYCAFMDADGQHDPRQVMPALDFLKKSGSDMVIGSRFVRKTGYRVRFMRKVGIVFFRLLTYAVTGKMIYDTTSGFKLYNRKAIAFAANNPLGGYDSEFLIFLLRNGCTISEMPVVISQRKFGKSMYTWKHSVIYPVKTLTAIFRVLCRPRRKNSFS